MPASGTPIRAAVGTSRRIARIASTPCTGSITSISRDSSASISRSMDRPVSMARAWHTTGASDRLAARQERHMSDSPAGVPNAAATLKAGSLHWLQVAALGHAIAISRNVSGWDYGLGVGGWGGMLLAALAMAVLFLCLTQSLAELAAALPEAGGFDGYVRRALGPTAAYLAGMSVAVALAVGAGLAVSFSEAYVSAWLGFGGLPGQVPFFPFFLGVGFGGAKAVGGL